MFKFDFILDVENLNDNLLKAEKIVNAYGSILLKEHEIPRAGPLFAIPISKLPYTKKEIKTAIKLWLLSLVLKRRWKAVDLEDPSMKVDFNNSYHWLAEFIDDDKAKVVIDFWEPFFEDMQRRSQQLPKKTTEELLETFKAYEAEIEARLKERHKRVQGIPERVQEIQDEIDKERLNLYIEIGVYCKALSGLNEILGKEPDTIIFDFSRGLLFHKEKFFSDEKAVEALATVVYLYEERHIEKA